MNNHTFNYVYPPDFKKAQRHRLANRIFKGNLQSSSEECECCGKRVGDEQVETSCGIDPNQLSFLGPGIPLFFLFLKFIIFLLLVMSIFFMGFAVFSNLTSNDCGTISSCVPDLFNTLSLINKRSKTGYLQVQSYLGLVFVMVCILFFHYFRYKARGLMQQCDEVVDSPSDYAIILRRLPEKVTEAEIRQLIEDKKAELTPQELTKTCQLKVNNIVLSYQLKEYLQVKEKSMKTFKRCIKKNRLEEFKCQELPKPTEASQIAIVVFESQASKDFFIHQPKTSQKILQFFCTPCIPLSDSQIRGENIGIQRAPEPDEIYWQNSGITMRGAICRKSMTGAISVLVLLVGGGTQYGLSLMAKSDPDSTVLNTASSLLVTIFNVVLMLALGFLTKKERNETETEDQTVLMVKVTIFQFLNAGIFVIIAQIAANYSTFSLDKGIISQITMIMILNAIVPNVTLLFLDYTQIINRVLRFCVEKGWLVYSQVELNQIFIGSVIQLPNKYAYILKTLWLTALYAPLIPVVIGVSMLGLIFFYFVEKFLYTRSYCMPSNVSSMSFESAVELLQYFLITFAMGEFIIYYYFFNFQYENVPLTWTATILGTISLAVLNSVLPMEAINKSLFSISNSSKSELTYSEVQSKLEVTYDMVNPACESKRKRNQVGLANNSENKKVAVEMVNLFLDSASKNNESFMSQKPLLNDVIERQSEQERKEGEKERKEAEKERKEGEKERKEGEKEGDKERKESDHSDEKEGDKGLDGEQQGRKKKETDPQQIKKGDGKQLKSNKNKQDNTDKSKIDKDKAGKDKQDSKVLSPRKKEELERRQRQQQQQQLVDHVPSYDKKQTKKRKYDPPQQAPPPIQKKTFQIVDPFQDLSAFTPPRFIIRMREQQAQLTRQKQLQQKQEQKRAAQAPPPKLTRLTEQSSIGRPPILSPTGNLETNLQNIYANILTKQGGAADSPQKKQIVRHNPVQLSLENVPIDSKYHKSGGKTNIYQEYIDPKHTSNAASVRRVPQNKIQRPKKQHSSITDEQSPRHQQKRNSQSKDNPFKFVIVNEVPLKKLRNNPMLNQQSKNSLNDQKNGMLGLANLKGGKSQKSVNMEPAQDVNETFRDQFGKASIVNSRSSLNNDPEEANRQRQEAKQKKAIYNPIALQGSYKKYFAQKYGQDQGLIEGFLNKKVVMSYIGTPFVNLAKNMQGLDHK